MHSLGRSAVELVLHHDNILPSATHMSRIVYLLLDKRGVLTVLRAEDDVTQFLAVYIERTNTFFGRSAP